EPSLGGLLRMHDFRKSMQYRGAKPRSPAVHRRGPRMSAHSAARGKPRMLDCATLRQPSWTADFCANTAAKRLSTHGATTPLEPCVLTAATLQVQSKFADSTPAGQTREREREREREKERGREGERGREEQKKGEAKARTTLAPTTRRPGHGRAAPLAAVPALWERLMLRCSSFPHATRREFARACPFPVKTAGLAEVPNASGGGQKREEEVEEEEEEEEEEEGGGTINYKLAESLDAEAEEPMPIAATIQQTEAPRARLYLDSELLQISHGCNLTPTTLRHTTMPCRPRASRTCKAGRGPATGELHMAEARRRAGAAVFRSAAVPQDQEEEEEEEEEEDRATWPAGGLLRARVGSTAPPRTPSAAQPERPILESAQTRLPVHILPARPPQKNAGWTTRESNSSRGQRRERHPGQGRARGWGKRRERATGETTEGAAEGGRAEETLRGGQARTSTRHSKAQRLSSG
ncbi:unnamed protein product, partial [Prorocentrum cordatum]